MCRKFLTTVRGVIDAGTDANGRGGKSRSVIAHKSKDLVIEVCQVARLDKNPYLEALFQRNSIGCRTRQESIVAIKSHSDVEL